MPLKFKEICFIFTGVRSTLVLISLTMLEVTFSTFIVDLMAWLYPLLIPSAKFPPWPKTLVQETNITTICHQKLTLGVYWARVKLKHCLGSGQLDLYIYLYFNILKTTMLLQQWLSGKQNKVRNNHENCHHVKLTNWAQVWNKGDLVQQTIGLSSPGQPLGGWLIRDPWQENVKMILEEGKVPRVLISEIDW